MKKIYLYIGVFFFSFFSFFETSLAQENIIISPDFSFISSVANQDGSVIDITPIRGNNVSANQFCVEMGGFYVSHTTLNSSLGSTRFNDVSLLWINSSNNKIIETITCDIFTSGGFLPSNLSSTGTLSIINFNSSTGDYIINIPSLMFIISYVIVLFFSLFFLYFTTLFIWKQGKKVVR